MLNYRLFFYIKINISNLNIKYKCFIPVLPVSTRIVNSSDLKERDGQTLNIYIYIEPVYKILLTYKIQCLINV